MDTGSYEPQNNTELIPDMANDLKTGKKAATKAPKVAGVHKVPKYEKDESDATPNPIKITPKGGK